MAIAMVNGVKLYYEVTGEGFPPVLSHEFMKTAKRRELRVRWTSHKPQPGRASIFGIAVTLPSEPKK